MLLGHAVLALAIEHSLAHGRRRLVRELQHNYAGCVVAGSPKGVMSSRDRGHRSGWKTYLSRFESLALLALASLLVWLAAAPNHSSHQAFAPQRSSSVTSPTIPAAARFSFPRARGELHIGRPLYPYSVIPGGVESVAELRNAVANDPVVAAHYAGFDFAHAHVVRLAKIRSAFVSYRKDNTVFWTSKKLNLPAGEALITDGAHASRTRCGNQVSDVPRTPIASTGEPPPETLTTPVPFETLQPPLESALEPPLLSGILPPVGDTDGPFIPPVVPIVGGGTSPSGPILPPPVPPLTPTPEPATLLLTASGLFTAWVARKLRKS